MPADSMLPERLRAPLARHEASLAGAARLTSAVLLVLLPKCPLCWAGYAALAASVGLQIEASYARLVFALYVELCVGVLGLWFLPSRRGALAATWGALLVIAGRSLEDQPLVGYIGLALVLAGLATSFGSRRRRPGAAAQLRGDAPSCC
jgi:hypothetical protein